MKLAPLVVAGSIAIDRIMSFNGYYREYLRPEHMSKLSLSILVDDLIMTHGGGGANVAYSLALLNESPVLLGAVGPDAGGYMKQLADMGVDMSHVHRSLLPTAAFHVMTDSDQNQVGGFYPGAMSDSESLGFGPWKDDKPICVVSAHDPDTMRRQVAECARWKLRLLYDVGQQVSNVPAEDLIAGLNAASVLIVNEYEMGVLEQKTGLSREEIRNMVRVVVTTMGRDGSQVSGSAVDSVINVGIAKPARMTDPTGAGDAYRAGWLYGWRRDWDWKVCAQLGAVCAAYAVETPGTQGHTFTLARVAARYEASFGSRLPD